jgi:predicted ester cyclase
MTSEAMKQLFLDFETALENPEKNAEKLSTLLDDNFVLHGLAPGMSLARYRASLNTGMPDGKIEVLHLIAEGNFLAARLRLTGTHKGVLWGMQPTEKKLDFVIFEFFRIQDSKMAEQWAMPDFMSVYKQLGVTHLPG